MNRKLWLLCVAAVLGLAACGKKEAPASGAPTESTQSQSGGQENGAAQAESEDDDKDEAAAGNLLSNAAALQKAEDELKAMPQFGGKALNVFQDVRFYGDGRIMINVQDPNNPENIDEYEYKDGKWGEAQPVQISGGGDMKDNVTPLDQIKFAQVAEMAKVWTEKAKEVGAEETEMDYAYFTLFVPFQQRTWNTGSIETPRAKYSLSFNLDGSVKDFKKQ